jgi:predicted ATPase with chaperone activity
MVLPPGTVGRMGPAVNSGRAILFYGAPGNGKSSVAESVGHSFTQSIFIPHAIHVDGQIIKIFDPTVHEPCAAPAGGEAPAMAADPRWVRCRRPVILTGGELTLEMLDLTFDPVSKYYEAPAHIKAVGGLFILDDFGRQRVRPQDLLNRWILPLERRVDFLTLHTGKKLQMPFDELVVFSTNFPPKELMDEAGLRRIPYKFHMAAPTRDEYETIFLRVCDSRNIEVPPEILPYLFDTFYPATGTPVSCAHPRFLMDHVVARCHFAGETPALTLELLCEALQNLVVDTVVPLKGGTPQPEPPRRRPAARRQA